MTDRLLTKRTLLSLAGTVAVTGLMMSVSDPVMAAGEARAASHPASVSVSVSVAATADPANGDVHINSVSAGAKVSLVTVPDVKYTCIVETRKHSKVMGYKPLSVHNGGRSHSVTWLLSPYSVKHARFIGNTYTSR